MKYRNEFINGDYATLAEYIGCLEEREGIHPSKERIYTWSADGKWILAKEKRKWKDIIAGYQVGQEEQFREYIKNRHEIWEAHMAKVGRIIDIVIEKMENGEVEIEKVIDLVQVLEHEARVGELHTKEEHNFPQVAIQNNQWDAVSKRIKMDNNRRLDMKDMGDEKQ